MANDEPRQRFRDRLFFRKRKETGGPGLPVHVPRYTPNDPSIPPPTGGTSSTNSETTIASNSNVAPVLSQKGTNTALTQTLEQEDPKEARSLWALAYDRLQEDNPELTKKFSYCLGVSNTDTDHGNVVYSRIDGVTQKALEELKETDKSKEKLNRTTSAMRKYFNQALKVIIASKDYIALAVSANPYAALAWTGASLLLPLLLNPTQENEAAMKGLDYIVNLIVVYRWQEKIYLHRDDSASDFKDLAIRLYTMILEYEATLLVHKHQNPPKRWARDVFQAGAWSNRVIQIQLHVANCRAVTDAIVDVRTKEWRDEERKWQDELLQQPRKDEERRDIRKLYSNYEAGKNVNPERITGTCEWFLNHTDFLTWRESQSSSLLWLSADPGCGKSVLSKYLVDRRGEVLTANTETPVVCYYFFKDGDVDRIDGAKAICAFLHQLFMQRPHLYLYAKEGFEYKSEKFLTDFDALWNIFLKAAEDPSGHEIICVLDALDECQEYSRKALIAKLVQLYRLRGSTNSGRPILKFLVTSRPDFNIVRDFKDLTSTLSEIRLRGEAESEQISREIDLVIRHKVDQLGSKMDLHESDQSALLRNLCNTPHRTYLWLHLTFDDIAKKLELTKDDIAVIAKSIPKDVDEAYTAILDKSPDRGRARRLLHIILAAIRPLTLQEMNVAVVIEERHQSYKDLDIWQPNVSEDRIKNMCGLFVSVVDSKVYLIHQTAREFLLGEESDSPSSPQTFSSANWKNSFFLTQSNLLLAKICIWYLQLRDFEEDGLALVDTELEYEDIERYEEDHCFLSYAAKHWATHFTQAKSLPESALIEIVAYKTCNTLSHSFRIWSKIYYKAIWPYSGYGFPSGATDVIVASYFGHEAVVKLLLKQEDVQANSRDKHGRTSLSWAAARGHEAVVRLLLKREDVQADSKDVCDRTPLLMATYYGHEAVVKLLLEREDVQADSKDVYGLTSLLMPTYFEHETVIKLLLEREDVQTNTKNDDDQTSLSWATKREHEAMIKLLLKREDVQTNSKNKDNRTPLWWAIANGHERVVELLLERGAQADSKDKDGRTPLWWATKEGHEAMVRLLLKREDVQADSKDVKGKTPLALAAKYGHEAMVRLLLERGVQADSKDVDGKTPLSSAAKEGHETIVKLLLKRGVQADSKDVEGDTPLSWAARMGHEAIVKLLLERGAQVDSKNVEGWTPLSTAKVRGHEGVVKLLEEHLQRTYQPHPSP